MAMAGQGFNAQPPPRPASHNVFGGGGGGGQNPGNQLYVGNVIHIFLSSLSPAQLLPSASVSGRLARSERSLPRGGKYCSCRHQYRR